MRDMSGLIQYVTENFNPPFSLIMEMMLNEAAQWVNLKDWETNQQRWGKDDKNRMIGSKDFTLTYEDLEKTVVPGQSVSKTKNIFLPLPFAIPKEEAVEVMQRLLAYAKQNGSVTVSTWPAYGVEGTSTYPAQTINALPADERTVAQQVGIGGCIYAVDGNPLSRVMTMPLPIGSHEEKLTEIAKFHKWAGITTDETGDITGGDPRHDPNGPVPEWLLKLSKLIDDTIRAGEVKVELSRVTGFEGEIIFSTNHGDSVLLLSKERSKGGYVFRKKMVVNGTPADYDAAVSRMMKEFQASYKRRPRGVKNTGEGMPVRGDAEGIRAEIDKARRQLSAAGKQLETGDKRQPRLKLRDWLKQTENGYMLRRDFRAEDIARLLQGGINYIDGVRLSDPNTPIPTDEPQLQDVEEPQLQAPERPEPKVEKEPDVDSMLRDLENFDEKLDRAMDEPITEDVDGFLSIIEKPWSVDDRGLFKYLATSGPDDMEDWVNALDIAVNDRGLGNRWVFALVEQTHEKLGQKLPIQLRPIVLGMLEQIQAAPYPHEQDVPGPDLPPGPPKPPKGPEDFDDDYNPEADLR